MVFKPTNLHYLHLSYSSLNYSYMLPIMNTSQCSHFFHPNSQAEANSQKCYGCLPGVSYDMINFFHQLQLLCLLKTSSQLDLLSFIFHFSKGMLQRVVHGSFSSHLLNYIKEVSLVAMALFLFWIPQTILSQINF